MKLAVITALPAELWAIRAALGQSCREWRIGRSAWRSSVAGHEVLVVEAGMGFDNAARTAVDIIRAESPELIVSAGFCGGLTADLLVGDVVIATRLFSIEDNRLEEEAIRIADISLRFAAVSTPHGRLFGGYYVSTPRMLPKQRLVGLLQGDTKNPVVVEMESVAIARIAAGNDISFAAIRTVSDPLNEELGFSLDEFCDIDMNIRLIRVLKTCLNKPRIIPQLIRLSRNSRVAANSLSQAFKRFLSVV
jgi:adenosylhomocysteine nucleosidase